MQLSPSPYSKLAGEPAEWEGEGSIGSQATEDDWTGPKIDQARIVIHAPVVGCKTIIIYLQNI